MVENNMADQKNNVGTGTPRMKKVKRPVKKIKVPVSHSKQGPIKSYNAPAKVNDVDAFDLDAYLDINDEQTTPDFVTDGYTEQQKVSKFIVGDLFTKNFVILVSVMVFMLGIFTAKIFLVSEKTVGDGLQGVVINPEVPRGRARCGVAERTQGCVLYIMNPQRQELNARDFYDLAAQLTGRQKFIIETGNMRYSNTKIRPGAIAQFNIPPN